MPKYHIRKRLAAQILQRIIENVAARRQIPWELITSEKREKPEIADARVLAMAVCCSAGFPPATIAKVFGRTWQTVDSARAITIQRCTECADTRDEFIAILTQSLKP